ncbi:MAG: HPr family phosphocarrier protein [Bacteroidales bacterium]|jgi:phosphocarrier protein|nr:HPr family phosphocarrier protein [Bacteroidales bacterium]
MITKDYTVIDPLGMHARPATALVKLARNYKSLITINKDGKNVPLKSMINILGMAIKAGDSVTVITEGEDEQAASAALDDFFYNDMKNF